MNFQKYIFKVPTFQKNPEGQTKNADTTHNPQRSYSEEQNQSKKCITN